jgi:hypothetical protein
LGGFLAYVNKHINKAKTNSGLVADALDEESANEVEALIGRIALGAAAGLLVPLFKLEGMQEFYGLMGYGLAAGFAGPAVLAAAGKTYRAVRRAMIYKRANASTTG